MFERIRRVAIVAGAAAMLLVVAGNVAAASPAKLTAVVATDDTGSPAAGMAWIRVLHASPDAPAVDVYVDGAKAITDLAFGSITDYTPVTAGNHAIKVCATGSTTVCPIDVPALAVADGMKYTIAATNELAKITAQVITDAPSATHDRQRPGPRRPLLCRHSGRGRPYRGWRIEARDQPRLPERVELPLAPGEHVLGEGLRRSG